MPASSVSTNRALLLCASGALVGLGIAGYGLFTAARTSSNTVAPANVATVNQRPILRSDFIAQLESETGKRFGDASRAEQLQVLAEMVREELLVQRALELDFGETDQSVRNALVSTISDQAVAEVTTSQVTEPQLRQYFQQHRQQWASEGVMSLRHWQRAATSARPSGEMQSEARRVLEDLRSGAAAADVAARHAMQEAQRQDDEYYFTVKYRLGDSLFAAIKDLAAGAVSAPVLVDDGLHIVQMIKNDKPIALTYEAARPQVVSGFNAAAEAHLMEIATLFLRRRAKILVASDFARDYRP